MIVKPMRADSATSAASSWRTPQWLVARIRDDVFGGMIELDPCTCDDNPVDAVFAYTPEDDGLVHSWQRYSSIFVNPPFIDAAKWADKAIREARTQKRPHIVFLAPAAIGTKWVHDLWAEADDAVWLKQRLRFEDGNGNRCGSPTRGTVLFSLNCTLRGLADLGTRAAA